MRFSQGTQSIASGQHLITDLMSTYETDIGANVGEVTVCRLIIDVDFQHTVVTTTPDPLSMGIMVVGREAAGVGSTAVPSPRDNKHADWMWWTTEPPSGLAIETSSGVWDDVKRYIHYDIRSMRKMDGRENVLIFTVHPASGVAMAYRFSVSALLLTK